MSRFYTIDGAEYPSVTTVLSILDKGENLLSWSAEQACKYISQNLNSGMSLDVLFENARNNFKAVRDEAGYIGSEVHGLIEQNIKGQWVDSKTLRPEVKKAFFAFLGWRKKYNVKFLHTEMTVHSKKHSFAGTLDAIVEFEGLRYVADWKTSGSIYDTFPLQISSYRECAKEMGIETHGEIIVRLDKNTGKFETKDYSDKHVKHFQSFLRLLDFYYAFKARRLKNNPRTMEGNRIAIVA